MFAPQAISIVGASAMALAAIVLFILRAGKVKPGFSERTRYKFLATMLAYLVLGVFYLCVALSSSFAHNLINGHWSPTGMWLAFGIASTAIAYAFGLAMSQNETYAWVYTFMQAAISTFLYLGARNIDHNKVPLVMSILAASFWAIQSYYYARWCTPSVEWQEQHGGMLYFAVRVAVQLLFAIYWVFFIVDVTYLNRFGDNEQSPWIAYLIVNFFVYFVGGWLANLYFNPDAMPPLGIWADVSEGVGFALRGGKNQALAQDLAGNPAAGEEEEAAVANGTNSAVPAAANSGTAFWSVR